MADKLQLPDGNNLTKEQMKEGLIQSVANEFRTARNDGYRTGDWIKYAAGKVVDHLFAMDQYFDEMMDLQKAILKQEVKTLEVNTKQEPISKSEDASSVK